MTAFPGPTPPETNPPINPQYYLPSRFVISAIGLGITTIVTTSVNHNYVVGQQVRLIVPGVYGTYQINGQDGFVMSIPSANQIVVSINSVGYNPFIATPAYSRSQPQILAIGDGNTGPINASGRTATGTFIPGSFIDISPA